jgi:hypothetical protein
MTKIALAMHCSVQKIIMRSKSRKFCTLKKVMVRMRTLTRKMMMMKRVVSKNPAVVYRVVKNAKEVPEKCDEE